MTNLAEKYRPKSYEDFLGDEEQLKTIEKNILENKHTLLAGPPGVGKTTAAYLVANRLDYKVIEINSSDERLKIDLERILERLIIKSLYPTVYLIDEADGIKDQQALAFILSKSKKPVILTANYKRSISQAVKRHAKLIDMRAPPLLRVVELIRKIAKEEGKQVKYGQVSNDIRASINNVFGNGKTYKPEPNDFEKVELIFKAHKPIKIDPIWLLDNARYFYSGIDLYHSIRTICRYAIDKDETTLLELPIASSGKANFPYLYRVARARKTNG